MICGPSGPEMVEGTKRTSCVMGAGEPSSANLYKTTAEKQILPWGDHGWGRLVSVSVFRSSVMQDKPSCVSEPRAPSASKFRRRYPIALGLDLEVLESADWLRRHSSRSVRVRYIPLYANGPFLAGLLPCDIPCSPVFNVRSSCKHLWAPMTISDTQHSSVAQVYSSRRKTFCLVSTPPNSLPTQPNCCYEM